VPACVTENRSDASDAQRLVEELQLEPHPEGGYFIETYRSGVCVDSDAGTRDALTSIYYLLPSDTFSVFHRLASYEIWYHYRRAPVTIETVDVDEFPQHGSVIERWTRVD
jgi:predicted cupin superfamily sugar epimerase